MSREDHPIDSQRAAMLAAALQELFDIYPTDEDTAPAVTLTLAESGEEHTVKLQPGQVDWLTTVVMDEARTCRNAHSDGTGQCGHCGGTGKASEGTTF
ncbi:hypothetical protein GCM10009548_95050 [Streptomyces malaysiensis subsp. malaysiensis]|uniref:hypothetical protein n=1 Tax=Streptomyces TaxID=1883 RepID=UPI001E4334C0|nr:hypothetical protein [Streptomyces sp. HNM0561]UHH23906.1 hypothetical protein LUV23_47545 [Streptomyces sp. HNM0561]